MLRTVWTYPGAVGRRACWLPMPDTLRWRSAIGAKRRAAWAAAVCSTGGRGQLRGPRGTAATGSYCVSGWWQCSHSDEPGGGCGPGSCHRHSLGDAAGARSVLKGGKARAGIRGACTCRKSTSCIYCDRAAGELSSAAEGAVPWPPLCCVSSRPSQRFSGETPRGAADSGCDGPFAGQET